MYCMFILYRMGPVPISLNLLLSSRKCSRTLLFHGTHCGCLTKVMVFCLRLTMRRLLLRTLMLSLLAIGIASAARVKHTVDLPTNPLHWQRYLKQLRSTMATQRLSLRYEVLPVPATGTGTEIKYADNPRITSRRVLPTTSLTPCHYLFGNL